MTTDQAESGASTAFAIGSEIWPGLSKLAEESGEVVQVIGKIIGAHPSIEHWDGTNLRVRLEEELADLSAAIVFVKQRCRLDEEVIQRRTALKLGVFNRWHLEQIHD